MDTEKTIFLACLVGLASLIGMGVMERSPGGFLAKPSPAQPAMDMTLYDQDQGRDKPHDWYIADQDFTSCLKTSAPAEKIQDLRMGGGEASTDESRDSSGNLISVEVSAPSANGLESTVWTYYTSIDTCRSALASRNSIPDEYR